MLGMLTLVPIAEPAAAWSDEDTQKAIYIAGSAGQGAAYGWMVADGVGAAIGAGVGALWGWLGTWLFDDQGDANALNAPKNAYAQELANITGNYLAMAHYNALTNTELAKTLNYYLARQAEWGAKALYDYQTAHGQAHVYNSAWVLQQCQVCNSSTAYLWNTQELYNSVLSSLDSIGQSFVGTYDGMSYGWYQYVAGGGNIHIVRSTSDDVLTARLTCAVNTSAAQYIYLNTKSPIYIQGAAGAGTLTLTDAADGVQTTFDYDAGLTLINASALLAGKYNLATSGSVKTICALAVPAETSSGTAYPAVVVYRIDALQDLTWECTMVDRSTHGDFYSPAATYIGQTGDVGSDYNAKAFFDIDGNDGSEIMVPLYTALQDMATKLTEVKTLITTANGFGQTFYNVLVLTGGQGVAPMPDFVFPDPSQMTNLTNDQIYAIYLAYVRQMGDWFANYSAMLPNNVTISVESLNLVCRGSIYNATGAMVYNGTTVWTPYVSVQDMNITRGVNCTFAEPGFLMVWGHKNNLSDDDWLSRDFRYVPVTVGWTVNATEILYQGESVDSVELTVTQINMIVGPTINPITPPQSLGDLDWLLAHWWLFAIIAGVVVLLGGIVTRNWMILVVALVLIAAGAIGWWLSGGLTGFNLFLFV